MVNKVRSETSTRDDLVEAARDLYWRQGYRGTSVIEILEKAGAGSGSLYHFFEGKEDLLAAVLERYLDLLAPMIVEPALAASDDGIEQVFEILAGYRAGLERFAFDFSCPIGRIALEVSDPSERIRRLIQRNFDAWCAAVESCLQRAPGIPDRVDRASLARFVLTTMEGAVMQAAIHRSLEPFDASVRHLRAYVESLRTPDPGPVPS